MQAQFGICWWVQLNAHNSWAKKNFEGIEVLDFSPQTSRDACYWVSVNAKLQKDRVAPYSTNFS